MNKVQFYLSTDLKDIQYSVNLLTERIYEELKNERF